jgi:hypothetical protein
MKKSANLSNSKEPSMQDLKLSRELSRKKELLDKAKQEAIQSVNQPVNDLLGIKNMKTALGNLLIANFTKQLSVLSQNTTQSKNLNSSQISKSSNKTKPIEAIPNEQSIDNPQLNTRKIPIL